MTPGWPRRLRSLAVVGAFLVLLAGCTSDSEEDGPTGATGVSGATGTAAPEPMRLEVLVDNVEYGGDAGTDAVIDARSMPTSSACSSPTTASPEIAANTGYPYYDVSLQLLSKYPIHEPSGAEGRYALIEVRPGEVVAFFNIHLDYVKYGPKLLGQTASRFGTCSHPRTRCGPRRWTEPLRLMRDLIAGYP